MVVLYDFEIVISYTYYFDKKKVAVDHFPYTKRSELQQKFEDINLNIKKILEEKTIFTNKYQYDNYTIYIKSRSKKAGPRKTIIVNNRNTKTIVKIKEIIIKL